MSAPARERTQEERWEKRYASRDHAPRWRPDPLLIEHRRQLRGRVIDLACGEGSNTLLAAMQGCQATGIDIAPAAATRARILGARLGLRASFETQALEQWPPLSPAAGSAAADTVLLFFYLDRDLCHRIVRALEPGGIVIARTFNQAQLTHRPGFNPDFVLRPGEWHALFDGLVELASSEGDAVSRSAWFIGAKR